MSNGKLKEKILSSVQKSGYPLEQRMGYCLQKRNWIPFHSITYIDPSEEKQRELDLLAYRNIKERRIELRISCKKSTSKPWIFFTEDTSRYHEFGSILKVTPVSGDVERYREIPKVLRGLPLFKNKRRAINFTAFSGKEIDKDARTLVKDGLYSTLKSVYHRLYPSELMFDLRGTVYLFIVILDGLMFESYYDTHLDQDIIDQIDYIQWETWFPLKRTVRSVPDHEGNNIPIGDVLYWFSDRFRVEVITWNHFETYLDEVESAFEKLNEKDLQLFGNSWRPENFPSLVGERPSLKPGKKNMKQ